MEDQQTAFNTVFLSDVPREVKTLEGNNSTILNSIEPDQWDALLFEFNKRVQRKWMSTNSWFGELVLMGTGLDRTAREELLNRMVQIRETRQEIQIL